MAVSINGTNGLTFNDGSTQTTSPFTGGFGFRNRIINGDMRIDQRNAGASGTAASAFSVDRWGYFGTQASKGTWQQNAGSVTPPAGFGNYLGFTSSSAYAVLSSDTFSFYQGIEGFNMSDFNFGTANAVTISLSFWVRSSLTGTFGGAFKNYAGTRSYPFTYTISAANTWEQKTITIPGDTSGTWVGASANGAAYVNFGLGQGSTYSASAGAWATGDYRNATGATSVVGTNGATFYITGVQLEKGSTATSFDYRPYGTELALCQRYLPAFIADTATDSLGIAQAYSTSGCILLCNFPTQARVSATGVTISSASHLAGWRAGTSSAGTPTSATLNRGGLTSAWVEINGWSSSGLVAGDAMGVFWNSTAGKLLFTGCEL